MVGTQYFAFSLDHLGLKTEPEMDTKRASGLSSMELDCLVWCAQGKPDHHIAMLISMSEFTVVRVIESAMKKLKAKNRTHALAIAISCGAIRADNLS